jgi:TBC1 domain family protein 5
MLESRSAYDALRKDLLRFIKHPEQLTELSFDPLADDPDSPWDGVRKDERIRDEILQDVQRLPDEPFYHQDTTQMMILDILFIYCKLNPDVGGYRQGMHELLAPIVQVVHHDALDGAVVGSGEAADPVMVQTLDSSFVEHDAFALFAKVMEHAKPFYEVIDAPAPGASEQSAIVRKSKYIHEDALLKADPELSAHLKGIEILPQIFLM